MGLQTFGFPPEIVAWLSKRMDLNLFVEAGTFHGESALRASSIFQRVITIEKSNLLFAESSASLKNQGNITCYNGCTRDHVIAHLNELDKPLFWLDAHWSGDVTAGQEDECPILDELSLIFAQGLNSFAILIDDARLFTAPPPRPHDSKQWPRIDEIAKKLPNDLAMYIFNDVIYILPNHIADSFSNFLQDLAALATSPPSKSKLGFAGIIKMLIPVSVNKSPKG